jgi:hypothetical protein
MADSSNEKVSKGKKIRFTLDVTATVSDKEISKIDFELDLNPLRKLIRIEDRHSSHEELALIFDKINQVLKDISSRTEIYNSATKIDLELLRKYEYDPKYEENFKPSFGKINSIHYRHESPGESNVSYSRSYNGDMKPPGR